MVNLPIFANVEGDMRLIPGEVSFGLLDGPLVSPVSQTVKLVNSKGLDVKILSVKTTHPSLKASARPVGPDGSHEFIVTLKKGATGTLRTQVKITTNHPDSDQKTVSLPVYGIISRNSDSSV